MRIAWRDVRLGSREARPSACTHPQVIYTHCRPLDKGLLAMYSRSRSLASRKAVGSSTAKGRSRHVGALPLCRLASSLDGLDRHVARGEARHWGKLR